MFQTKKKVVIYRKADSSYFATKNAKVLPEGFNKIGPSINAINAITLQTDMLNELMPKLLGMGSSAQDFFKKVNYYWNSLSVNIPENGKELEIGFAYILKDSRITQYLDELKSDGKTIKFSSDEHLGKYVESNVEESEKWKFGVPINTSDYLLWRYSLNYGDVANSIELRDKSTSIRFYVHNVAEMQKIESNKLELRKKAGKIYYDAVDDMDTVNDYLIGLGQGTTASMMDDITKHKLLEKCFMDDPQSIIDISKDKSLKAKVFVEKCILNGILRRLPNSTLIANATDNSVIGNSVADVVAFLGAEVNVKLKNEIEGRLKGLKK